MFKKQIASALDFYYFSLFRYIFDDCNLFIYRHYRPGRGINVKIGIMNSLIFFVLPRPRSRINVNRGRVAGPRILPCPNGSPIVYTPAGQMVINLFNREIDPEEKGEETGQKLACDNCFLKFLHCCRRQTSRYSIPTTSKVTVYSC